MSDNWIDNLSEKVHKQDADDLKDEQRRLHETQVISEKSRGFWDDLISEVQRDVRRFEKDFPQDPKRVMEFNEISPTCFRVSRADHPPFSCNVELHPENAQIEFKYVRTSGDDVPSSGWSGTLVFRQVFVHSIAIQMLCEMSRRMGPGVKPQSESKGSTPNPPGQGRTPSV